MCPTVLDVASVSYILSVSMCVQSSLMWWMCLTFFLCLCVSSRPLCGGCVVLLVCVFVCPVVLDVVDVSYFLSVFLCVQSSLMWWVCLTFCLCFCVSSRP